MTDWIPPGPLTVRPINPRYFAPPDGKAAEIIPMGRLDIAEDIAGLAAFLASDEVAYCTGGFYMCEGGLTAV